LLRRIQSSPATTRASFSIENSKKLFVLNPRAYHFVGAGEGRGLIGAIRQYDAAFALSAEIAAIHQVFSASKPPAACARGITEAGHPAQRLLTWTPILEIRNGQRAHEQLKCGLSTQRRQGAFQRFAFHSPRSVAQRRLGHERVTFILDALPITVPWRVVLVWTFIIVPCHTTPALRYDRSTKYGLVPFGHIVPG